MTWREKLIAGAIAAFFAFLGALGGGTLPTRPTPPTTPIVVPPPAPAPEATPQPQIDKTIARIQVGNAGCTAALIGPRRVDRRYNLLTAAHCVPRVGARGTYFAQDGSRLAFEIVGMDKAADCAWGLTDATDKTYPHAELSEEDPQEGESVWHAGFGIDKPGNREEGVVVSPGPPTGKTHYYLSVSSGDSGGAIVSTRTGRILSVVCCSDGAGRRANVYGANVNAIRALRSVAMVDPEWTPLPLPTPEDHAEKK